MLIHYDAHIDLVSDRLSALLVKDGFASKVWRQLGSELHALLVDEPFEDDAYSVYFPVEALFELLSAGECPFGAELFKDDDGIYRDDDGEAIPQSVAIKYAPAEQMAAYGLWLISELIHQWGPLQAMNEAEEKRLFDERGVRAVEALEDRAACILSAYQALIYSQRLACGDGPTEKEAKRSTNVDFAALGAKGGRARHAPTRKLRAWALDRYTSRKWKSANEAAHSLAAEVVAYGRTIGVTLTPSNAQRTIAEWFRRHDRDASSG